MHLKQRQSDELVGPSRDNQDFRLDDVLRNGDRTPEPEQLRCGSAQNLRVRIRQGQHD